MSGAPAGAALVTGGSSGIGLAIARTLGALGYGLTLAARRADRLEAAAATLRAAGADVATFAADLAGDDAAASLLDFHAERHGRLDVLVANAGTSRRGGLAAMDTAHVHRLAEVNVVGPFLLVRDALPSLRAAAGERGRAHVLLTSSIVALRPIADYGLYAATKAALVSLARSVNLEEGDAGVRACALCPAFVDTPMTAPLAPVLAPGDLLPADDVAEAVAFLLRLSPRAVVNEIVMERAGAGPLAP